MGASGTRDSLPLARLDEDTGGRGSCPEDGVYDRIISINPAQITGVAAQELMQSDGLCGRLPVPQSSRRRADTCHEPLHEQKRGEDIAEAEISLRTGVHE